MFVFENNGFTERQDLNAIYEEIFDGEDDLDNALGAVGFQKESRYYHKRDTGGLMGIEVSRQISKDISVISKEFEFFVDWFCMGDWIGVLIRNKLDLQDFLAKYLPVVNLTGELTYTGECCNDES
ncbi:hypothetical protein [Psychrobacter sp. UBA3480]|uniref:hypothetical protein n=1 Tax=Psychrobacter sp. UBA3480 TaxID=1947350 RepID=UPI0025D70720|nr:hypothetical protein [Psychrobacter sp. UBA3480]